MRKRVGNIRNEEDYFRILCGLAGIKKPLETSGYKLIMKKLYNTEFYWNIPNDDNRALDGKNLRDKFGWNYRDRECSFLEMLLALAIRCDEDVMYTPEDGDRTEHWFWMMMQNLGLSRCRDNDFEDSWTMSDVTYVTENMMARDYATNGIGGLFPLRRPKKDQRKVEIWYQMSAYLLENYKIG